MQFVNDIRKGLENGEFLYTLEYVPDLISEGSQALDKLALNSEKVGKNSRIRGLNIGDRVKSSQCFSTVECGRISAVASGKIPLLHLAGKDRLPHEAREIFRNAVELGLTNMLLISGDRINEPTRPGRVRYHESVVSIHDVKTTYPDVTVAAAVSPFKYREEELANQYLKMAKKINLGADYLITNCGWDMKKFQELIWYRDGRGFDIPVVANLLLPTLAWARGIHSGRLPGVQLSDDLFQKITEEYDESKTAAREKSIYRLATMVVGVKLMGYSGVQLSGVDNYESLTEIIALADEIEGSIKSFEHWEECWERTNYLKSGKTSNTSPFPEGVYLFRDRSMPEYGSIAEFPDLNVAHATEEEFRTFHLMDEIHRHVFKTGSIGAGIMKSTTKVFSKTKFTENLLFKIEHITKGKTLGCESCGFCRIDHLMFICPETCPKGLANGPCSGTDNNICEFRDRECIHNKKYRIAKDLNQLDQFETVFIPAVEGTRGTSSWINQFSEDLPKVIRLAGKNTKTLD